jgi:hypothetical protein
MIKAISSYVLAALCSVGAVGVTLAANPVQSAEPMCILAGRLDAQQRWAPQTRGIELLDAAGKAVKASDKAALGSVKQVRVSSPAILSSCNGSAALPSGDDSKAAKSSVPAIKAGSAPIAVDAVAFPPLRVGGELVELRVTVAADRVVSLTR